MQRLQRVSRNLGLLKSSRHAAAFMHTYSIPVHQTMRTIGASGRPPVRWLSHVGNNDPRPEEQPPTQPPKEEEQPAAKEDPESEDTIEDRRELQHFFATIGKMGGNDALHETRSTKDFDKVVLSMLRQRAYPISLAPAILNPLFGKYRFDLSDFCKGLRQDAYPLVNELMAMLTESAHLTEKHSKEELHEASQQLQSLLGDDQWQRFQKQISDKENKAKLEPRVRDPQLAHINVYYLNARIVGDYLEPEAPTDGDASKPTEANPDAGPKDPDVVRVQDTYLHSFFAPYSTVRKSEDLRRYVKGSVVATVKCSLFVHQEHPQTKRTKLVVETWTVEGCISGQTPLEWTVTDIRGPKAATFPQIFWYHMLRFAGAFTLSTFGNGK